MYFDTHIAVLLLLSGCDAKKTDVDTSYNAQTEETVTEKAEQTDYSDSNISETQESETDAQTEALIPDKIIEGVTFKLYSDDIDGGSQHTSAQSRFLAGKYTDILQYANGSKSLDLPEPIISHGK